MIDVPKELVQYLGRLLAAERRAKGTRRDTRALSCFYQALLVLLWFRNAEDLTLLGAGFGISRATAYRYRDEGVAVLAAQAQDLHTALRRVADDAWSHVILDGKLFDCDRLTETTISVKGETIDALVLRKAPRFRREHPSRHVPGRATDLYLRRDARTPARHQLRPATSASSPG